MQKRFLALSLATAALAFVGAGCTMTGNVDVKVPEPVTSEPVTSEPVFCTQDAKLCPDGSYVGRTGPNCEFAPCLGSSVDTNVDVQAY